jgi:hypothetical protein
MDRLVEGVQAGTVVTVPEAFPDEVGGSGDAALRSMWMPWWSGICCGA